MLSQDFTNLIRKNDTVTAKTTIENVGNSLAKDVTISDAGNLVHAEVRNQPVRWTAI